MEIERRPDGVLIVSGKAPLKPYDPNLAAASWRHADRTPQAVAGQARGAGTGLDPIDLWRGQGAGRLGRGLVDGSWRHGRAADPGPVGELLNHAVLIFAGMVTGVPVTSVSTNYSLISSDFERLRHVVDLVKPGPDLRRTGRVLADAIAAVVSTDAVVVTAAAGVSGAVDWSELVGFPAPSIFSAHVVGLDPTKPARYLLDPARRGVPRR